jgi:hypothetical protein
MWLPLSLIGHLSICWLLLAGQPVLGLDVEWKPSHTAGVVSPAAVLQVLLYGA